MAPTLWSILSLRLVPCVLGAGFEGADGVIRTKLGALQGSWEICLLPLGAFAVPPDKV